MTEKMYCDLYGSLVALYLGAQDEKYYDADTVIWQIMVSAMRIFIVNAPCVFRQDVL